MSSRASGQKDERRDHRTSGARPSQGSSRRQSGAKRYLDRDRPELGEPREAGPSRGRGFARQEDSQLGRWDGDGHRYRSPSPANRSSTRFDARKDGRPSPRSPHRDQKRRRSDSVHSDRSGSRSPSRDRQDTRRSRRATSRDRSPSPRRARRASPSPKPPQIVSAARWLDNDSPEPEVTLAPTRVPRDLSQPIPRRRAASPLSDPVYRYCLSFPTSLFPIIRGPNGSRTRQLVAYSNLFRLSLMQPKGDKSGYAQLIGSKEAIKEGWEAVKEVLKDHLSTMDSSQRKDCESLAAWPEAKDHEMEALGESKEEFAARAQKVVAERDTRSMTHETHESAPRPPPPPSAAPTEARPRWRQLQPAAGSPPSAQAPPPPLSHRLNIAQPPSHHFAPPSFARDRDQGWGPRTNEPLAPQAINPPLARSSGMPPPPHHNHMLGNQFARPPPPPPPPHPVGMRSQPPRDAYWIIENRRSPMLHNRFSERGVPAFWVRLPPEACGAVVGKEQHKLMKIERNSDTLLWIDGKGETASVLYIWGTEFGATKSLQLATHAIQTMVNGHEEWEGVLVTYAGDVVPRPPTQRPPFPPRGALYRPPSSFAHSPPRHDRGRGRGRSPTPRRRSASPRGRSPAGRVHSYSLGDRSRSRGRSYSSRGRSRSRSRSYSRSRSRSQSPPRGRARSYSRSDSSRRSSVGHHSASPDRRRRPSTYRYSPPPAPQRSPSPHRPWESPRKTDDYHDARRGSSSSFQSLRPRSPSPLCAPPDDSDPECLLGGQSKEDHQLVSSAHSNANTVASSASSTFSAIQEAHHDEHDEHAEPLASPPSSVSSKEDVESGKHHHHHHCLHQQDEEHSMDICSPAAEEQETTVVEKEPSPFGHNDDDDEPIAAEEEQYSPTSPPPENQASPRVAEEEQQVEPIVSAPDRVEVKAAPVATVAPVQVEPIPLREEVLPSVEGSRVVRLVDSSGVAKVVEVVKDQVAPASEQQALTMEELQRAIEMVRRSEAAKAPMPEEAPALPPVLPTEVRPSPAAHRTAPLVIDTSIAYDDIFSETYNDDFFSMYTSFPDSPISGALQFPSFDAAGCMAHLHGSAPPPSSPVTRAAPISVSAAAAPQPVVAVGRAPSPLPFTSFSDDEEDDDDEILLAPLPVQEVGKSALFAQRLSQEPAEGAVSDDSSDSDASDDEVVEGEVAVAATRPLIPFGFPASSAPLKRRPGLSRSLLPACRSAAPKTLAEARRELKLAQSAIDAMGPAPAPLTPEQIASRKEGKSRRKMEKEQRLMERRDRNEERRMKRERVEASKRVRWAEEMVTKMEKKIIA